MPQITIRFFFLLFYFSQLLILDNFHSYNHMILGQLRQAKVFLLIWRIIVTNKKKSSILFNDESKEEITLLQLGKNWKKMHFPQNSWASMSKKSKIWKIFEFLCQKWCSGFTPDFFEFNDCILFTYLRVDTTSAISFQVPSPVSSKIFRLKIRSPTF